MKKFSLLALVIFLSSCSAFQSLQKPQPIDSLSSGAKLDFKKFFTGDIEGFAIVQDSAGKISSTKTIKINGKWDDNKGVIQHNFVLGDGTKDSRTWLVTLDSDGTFTAVGHDVSTPASGKTVGNAAQVTYSLLLGDKGAKKETKFEERMYLVDDKSMIIIVNSHQGFGSVSKSIISLKK